MGINNRAYVPNCLLDTIMVYRNVWKALLIFHPKDARASLACFRNPSASVRSKI